MKNMKKNLMIALGLLVAFAIRVQAEPATFSTDFPTPEGTSIPKGKPSVSRVVAIFHNNVALCAVAPGEGAAQKRLSEIVISPAAEKLLPPGSLAGRDATQVGKVVQKLVGENPAFLAQIVAIALKEMGGEDALTRESIVQAALAGLRGPQQDMKALAQVLALLASDPDVDFNAAALIAAKKTLVKNGVLAPDSTALEEMLVSMKVLAITESPVRPENENAFRSGDQGTGNVGSAPLGGGSGGGGGGNGGSSGGEDLPAQPAPVS